MLRDKVEEVILVDETDRPVGTMEKIEAHRKALLHRAFSVFIFNGQGNMLLQKRAADATPDAFAGLAQKYGRDDACYESLRKGIADHGRREDSGVWTSPATPGWASYRKKRDLLDQLTLDRGPKGGFNAAARPRERDDDARVARLEQQLADLQRRLASLETAQKAQKFKL